MAKYNSQAQPAPLTWGDLLEGTAQLATDGLIEVTDLVEAIHKEIVLRPFSGLSDSPIQLIYDNTLGNAYLCIKTLVRFSGDNSATALRLINEHLKESQQQTQLPQYFKIMTNAINGVMGDHLVADDNPMALPMLFYNNKGKAYKNCPKDKLSGRVVILVHGLCLSFYSWHLRGESSVGNHIQRETADTTILYLDYNTGKRMSENGHAFSALLEELVQNNPNISSIDLIGHSMGGLIARSAIFYGKQDDCSWLPKINNYISLGSPHHGALLEKFGYILQENLSRIPIAGKLSRLLDIRSAGIIDLRHGSVRDDDWKNLSRRMGLIDDLRRPAPLPSGINAFLIASSKNKPNQHHREPLGDGLVSVQSALGEHKGEHDLKVPEAHKALFYGISHLALQHHELVRKQITKWLNMPQKQKNKKGSRIIRYVKKYRIAS